MKNAEWLRAWWLSAPASVQSVRCSLSPWGVDTHDGLVTQHAGLTKTLGDALGASHQATVESGVSKQRPAFTASDFGRTLAGNNDGSAHGLGRMHLVVANGGPDEVGQGCLTG